MIEKKLREMLEPLIAERAEQTQAMLENFARVTGCKVEDVDVTFLQPELKTFPTFVIRK